jgi:single-strand DNA-binding protein
MTTSTTRKTPRTSSEPSPASADDNVVSLCGVLAAPPEHRLLPSGDELQGFRLTVRRPAGDRVKVDSIDCVARLASARRAICRMEPGDTLKVTGSLHRRFWRSGPAIASRYEVEINTIKRTRRADRESA